MAGNEGHSLFFRIGHQRRFIEYARKKELIICSCVGFGLEKYYIIIFVSSDIFFEGSQQMEAESKTRVHNIQYRLPTNEKMHWHCTKMHIRRKEKAYSKGRYGTTESDRRGMWMDRDQLDVIFSM